MPKVYTYKTAERKKHADKGYYQCVKCHKDILPGQERYEWSFRFGGTMRQHVSCGYPRQSQLTQSKMGEIYAAQEAVEDLIAAGPGLFERSDLVAELENLSEVIGNVASEYEEAAENFGRSGENQERYEALDAYQSEIDQAASEVEDSDDPIAVASDAMGSCPY
jgi:hypothetical protein